MLQFYCCWLQCRLTCLIWIHINNVFKSPEQIVCNLLLVWYWKSVFPVFIWCHLTQWSGEPAAAFHLLPIPHSSLHVQKKSLLPVRCHQGHYVNHLTLARNEMVILVEKKYVDINNYKIIFSYMSKELIWQVKEHFEFNLHLKANVSRTCSKYHHKLTKKSKCCIWV